MIEVSLTIDEHGLMIFLSYQEHMTQGYSFRGVRVPGRFRRGAFKKFEEKCCQIVNFHGPTPTLTPYRTLSLLLPLHLLFLYPILTPSLTPTLPLPYPYSYPYTYSSSTLSLLLPLHLLFLYPILTPTPTPTLPLPYPYS